MTADRFVWSIRPCVRQINPLLVRSEFDVGECDCHFGRLLRPLQDSRVLNSVASQVGPISRAFLIRSMTFSMTLEMFISFIAIVPSTRNENAFSTNAFASKNNIPIRYPDTIHPYIRWLITRMLCVQLAWNPFKKKLNFHSNNSANHPTSSISLVSEQDSPRVFFFLFYYNSFQ